MRILFVSETMGFLGGVEQFIFDCANTFKKHGYHTSGLFLKLSDRLNGFQDVFDKIEIVNEENIEETIIKNKPDIVYVHKIENSSITKVLSNFPSIRLIHDHSLYCPRSHKYHPNGANCSLPFSTMCVLCAAITKTPPYLGPFSFIKRFIDINANKTLKHFVVLSNFMKNELVKNGFNKDRVHIVCPYKIPHKLENEYKNSDILNVLYAGQIIRGKGIDTLIKAIAQTKDITLTIAGVGNFSAKIENLIKTLNLNDRITYKRWVAKEEMNSLYKSHHLTAVPSRWQEPFGMVGLESFANARAVITNDVGGINEWASDENIAILLNKHSISNWVEGLNKAKNLHQNGVLKKMGEAAYNTNIKLYNEEAFIKTHEKIFRTIIEETK